MPEYRTLPFRRPGIVAIPGLFYWLIGVVNRLDADSQTKGKFKIIIAGWDTEGSTTDVKFNKEFSKELQKRRIWDNKEI